MPFFSEGQDPLDGRVPLGLPEPPPFHEPTTQETIGAAFRQNNPVVSVLDALSRSRPDMAPVPGYNPVDRLSGTKDDDLIEQSLADVNPAQTDARIAKKNAEVKDRQTLAASGWFGTVSSVAAGLTDPSWFIPIAGEVRAGAAGLSIAGRAAHGMIEGALKSSVSEAALQVSQVTRTPAESAENIATNTLLMGLVGGGLGLLSPAERTAAKDGLESIRKDLTPAPQRFSVITNAAEKKIFEQELARADQGELPFVDKTELVPHEAPEPQTLTKTLLYHGSPYSFDKFDPTKIGTGTGEAGFGRGFHFTTDADEARWFSIDAGGGPKATVYRTNIKIEPDKILDLSAKISDQSSKVKELAEQNGVEVGSTGQTLYESLVKKTGSEDAATSALKEAGIKANRYDWNKGKHYVVFDDSDIEITHKNGVPVSSEVKQSELRNLTSNLSAAESDRRTMQLSRILLPENAMHALRQVPGVGGALDYTSKILMGFSPTLRVFSSASLIAKRAMGDLAETSLRFTQADQGITTARGGIPVDRLVKMQAHEGQLTNSQILRDQFIKYRGLQDSKLPTAAATIQDMRGQAPGKLSFDDFKTAVSSAMTDGDVHAVPEVAAAAKQIRSQVLDPVMRLAQRTMGPDGKPMLAEALEPPKGDKSFFPRLWNKPAIAARFNDVKRIFTDWLESEQSLKAAAKERLQVYSGALKSHELNIAKIEAKLSGRTDALEALQDKAEEITRLNKFAYQRAETLRTAEKKRIENARGGAVFETKIRGRGNQLADQASGKEGEIETLEQQLIQETDHAQAMRAKIEKEIADWNGTSAQEAKAALKAREKAEQLRAEKIAAGEFKGEPGRLESADSSVDRAVKAILKSDRDLSRQELEGRAAEIINRINTAPDGRLPYDIASGGPVIGPPGEQQQVRGSLNARDFAIPTSLVRDFVNTDTEHVIAAHLRTALPDIHLTDRFGDVEMQQVFKQLNEEYDARLAGAKTEKQAQALDRERKAMVRDLAATRDRVRGVYGWELAKTQPNAARIANAARSYNLITDLGTSVFNRMTDATNAVWRHGLMNVFRDGYAPFLKSMIGLGDGFGTAARQSMKDMGVGIDSAIGHLSHQWGDVIDNHMPGSKFERALAWAADKSMMVNLHGPWTDGMKTVAGTVAGAEFLRTAERFAGSTQTAKDTERMALAGIDATMATRIWKAYKDGGGQEFGTGTHVANTADWKDTQARDVFSSAVARSADQAVLTPGMEKPLWMSGPVVSLLGQYKSFVAAAHEKILISNLQQMDGRTLQGLVASLGMGMISYRAYTLWSGAPTSERPQDWIKEGISRSAILGWFTELNSMQAKFTGGSTDMFRAIGADHPLSRRQSNSALSELLGPTYSKMEGIAGGVNDAFHGTWTAMDTHKMRQAIFLQNLFAVRRLLDAAEDGFNESMGVKPLNRDPSQWPGAAIH